ncbi:MAG: ribosome biogenesis GTP-binding protein YihA/YsxC [Clostridiales bacterium]|jgi:GTP-binding protein|nr:ribosome biogenesis GTP-binding protein YihA/YsxC [Clostridiales bacterium]
MLNIKDVNFIKSAADTDGLILDGRIHIAVAGKSNVGKSSFINMLLNRNGAARVSGTPGRTRLINYFDVTVNGGGFILADLPGYGYARVSKEEKSGWGRLIETYLCSTPGIYVFLLTDIRHLPTDDDKKLIQYLHVKAVPFYIIANKSDKQSRTQNFKSVKDIASALKMGEQNIICVSSLKKTGRDDVLLKIEDILTQTEQI